MLSATMAELAPKKALLAGLPLIPALEASTLRAVIVNRHERQQSPRIVWQMAFYDTFLLDVAMLRTERVPV